MFVLILVVVDDGLVLEDVESRPWGGFGVLILVVMDNGIVRPFVLV